ncbi:MAG: hypothetical protein K5879_10150 [Lachnospiraceae bacterium]|nr:hypothetical protein [Lachnospiraceae bacterium]
MIFLNILKIIGFVLLGIIGLILFIILLVLIWPFKYKIEADYHEKFKAKAVLSFLFHFVRVIFTFEDGNPLLVAKVLWIKVYENNFSEEPEEELSDTDEIPDDFFDSSGEVAEGSTESPNEGDEAGESDESAYTKEKENEEEITEEDFGPGKEEIDEFMAKELPPESPKSVVDEFFDHIENIISKLREKWYNLKRSVNEFRKKARYYSRMIRYYYKVLHYKSMEPAFKMVKKTLIGIFKHIRPRKVRITLHYGADDPADTANAIAIYSMIYPYFRKQIRFDADFDQKIIEGNAYIKGHFQLCVLAFYAIRAYLNKHVRKMIKLFTREGKKHG